jgi:hypothetical protein
MVGLSPHDEMNFQVYKETSMPRSSQYLWIATLLLGVCLVETWNVWFHPVHEIMRHTMQLLRCIMIRFPIRSLVVT